MKYYAQRKLIIESLSIGRGELVGEGNVEAGNFKPAKGLEDVLQIGHIQARLNTGKIKTSEPPPIPSGGEVAQVEREKRQQDRDVQRVEGAARDEIERLEQRVRELEEDTRALPEKEREADEATTRAAEADARAEGLQAQLDEAVTKAEGNDALLAEATTRAEEAEAATKAAQDDLAATVKRLEAAEQTAKTTKKK